MSMRPIDFQVGVSRAAELHKINTNENNRPDIVQQAYAKEVDKQAQLEASQVVQANKSEFNTITEEGRENKGNNRQKKKNEKESKKTEQGQGGIRYNKNSTSMYDISI